MVPYEAPDDCRGLTLRSLGAWVLLGVLQALQLQPACAIGWRGMGLLYAAGAEHKMALLCFQVRPSTRAPNSATLAHSFEQTSTHLPHPARSRARVIFRKTAAVASLLLRDGGMAPLPGCPCFWPSTRPAEGARSGGCLRWFVQEALVHAPNCLESLGGMAQALKGLHRRDDAAQCYLAMLQVRLPAQPSPAPPRRGWTPLPRLQTALVFSGIPCASARKVQTDANASLTLRVVEAWESDGRPLGRLAAARQQRVGGAVRAQPAMVDLRARTSVNVCAAWKCHHLGARVQRREPAGPTPTPPHTFSPIERALRTRKTAVCLEQVLARSLCPNPDPVAGASPKVVVAVHRAASG